MAFLYRLCIISRNKHLLTQISVAKQYLLPIWRRRCLIFSRIYNNKPLAIWQKYKRRRSGCEISAARVEISALEEEMGKYRAIINKQTVARAQRRFASMAKQHQHKIIIKSVACKLNQNNSGNSINGVAYGMYHRNNWYHGSSIGISIAIVASNASLKHRNINKSVNRQRVAAKKKMAANIMTGSISIA